MSHRHLTHKLFHIGNRFYVESRTMMSSIYHEDRDNPQRWDWGLVSTALVNGEAVHIRPANEAEMEWAELALSSFKKSLKMLRNRSHTRCDHCERQYDDDTCDSCFAKRLVEAVLEES